VAAVRPPTRRCHGVLSSGGLTSLPLRRMLKEEVMLSTCRARDIARLSIIVVILMGGVPVVGLRW